VKPVPFWNSPYGLNYKRRELCRKACGVWLFSIVRYPRGLHPGRYMSSLQDSGAGCEDSELLLLGSI
jgi:hypothetical protein